MTLAHPAAVLPLQRLGLPMTALVIGSMVPDIPLFLGMHQVYLLTHSLVGVVSVNVVTALVVTFGWFFIVRDVLVDLAPNAMRVRLTPHVMLSRQQWLLAPVAAAMGAFTHVVWDSFTHSGRWGVQLVPWLAQQHGLLPGFRWLQYVSGVVGLAVVLVASARHLRDLPPLRAPEVNSPLASAALPAIAVVTLTIGLMTAHVYRPSGLHAMAFHAVINALLGCVLAVGVTCIAWHTSRARTNTAQQ